MAATHSATTATNQAPEIRIHVSREGGTTVTIATGATGTIGEVKSPSMVTTRPDLSATWVATDFLPLPCEEDSVGITVLYAFPHTHNITVIQSTGIFLHLLPRHPLTSHVIIIQEVKIALK